jgi:hypothetical protein
MISLLCLNKYFRLFIASLFYTLSFRKRFHSLIIFVQILDLKTPTIISNNVQKKNFWVFYSLVIVVQNHYWNWTTATAVSKPNRIHHTIRVLRLLCISISCLNLVLLTIKIDFSSLLFFCCINFILFHFFDLIIKIVWVINNKF